MSIEVGPLPWSTWGLSPSDVEPDPMSPIEPLPVAPQAAERAMFMAADLFIASLAKPRRFRSKFRTRH